MPAQRRLRSTSRQLALEPRLLFDGAAAVATSDLFDVDDQHTQPAEPVIQDHSTEAQTFSSSFAPESSLLELANDAAVSNLELKDAAQLAQETLENWVNSDNFRDQAALIFSADAGSPAWEQALQDLRRDIVEGSYSIRTEVRSNAELFEVLGAWTAKGTTGERAIYLNAEWLNKSDTNTIASVLLEELGHDIDDRLNRGADSTGDEGHAFASLLTTGDANLVVNLGRNDHSTLVLDGAQVRVENSGPYAIQQIHFVAMPENQLNTGIKHVYPRGSANTVLETVIAITATSNRTVVVYDHWEDGYESNINNPSGSTHEWTYTDADEWFIDTNKDFIKNNSEAAVANGTTIVANGKTLILNNNVIENHATQPGNSIFFDGRDKIGSTKAISVTRAGWNTGIGTIVGGAINLIDVSNSGSEYVIPVGTDREHGGGSALMSKTSLYIMAYEVATEVTIELVDAGGKPAGTITRILQQGESWFVKGLDKYETNQTYTNDEAVINDGTKVTAKKWVDPKAPKNPDDKEEARAIGVSLLGGTNTSQNRWFNLSATDNWGSSYYAPVATVGGAQADVYFYNNNSHAITITAQTAEKIGEKTVSVTIAGKTGGTFAMPASAAHFYTANGDKFYAVATVDRSSDRDWSYSLVAEKTLTDRFVTAWAPGNSTNTGTIDTSKADGSPIWVTSTGDTQLYVDGYVNLYSTDGATGTGNGSSSSKPGGAAISIDKLIAKDGTEITGKEAIQSFIQKSPSNIATTVFSINRLQSYRIYDATTAKSQSGLAVYTTDGTLITAAWGQDATVSSNAAPYLDMGTTVSPQPLYLITKTATEASNQKYGPDSSNENTLIELNEKVEYTITIENRAVVDLYNINIKDVLSSTESGSYVENTASLSIYDENGVEVFSIKDFDGNENRFPLLGPDGHTLNGDLNPNKLGIQGLQIGAKIVVKYAVQVRSDINSTLADDNYIISNTVTMQGNPPVGEPTEPKEVTIQTKVTAIDAAEKTLAEDATISGQIFKITETKGLQSVEIEGSTYTVAQLTAASPTNPLTVKTTEGLLTITGYSNDAVNNVGTVTYSYDPDGSSKDHTGVETVKDTVAIKAIYAGEGKEVSGNLVINITDTEPTAKDDTRTMEFGTESAPADMLQGNVYSTSGAGIGDVADAVPDTNSSPVTKVSAGTGAPTTEVQSGGTTVTGTYGKLTIYPNGSYSYDLDETLNPIANLKYGDKLEEVFSYEITDGDGSTAKALLTINIQNTGLGVDNITVKEASPYGVFTVTGTAGEQITLELLTTGSGTGHATSGADYANSLEYFDESSKKWEKYSANGKVTLQQDGTLQVRVPIKQDEYLNEVNETFKLVAKNSAGKASSGGLATIVDSVPIANPDTALVDNTSNQITGNVLNGVGTGGDEKDILRDDVAKVTDVTSKNEPDSKAVEADGKLSIEGQYGKLTIRPDGSYTYNRDDSAPLGAEDVFTYTITDSDGDESKTTLTIEIKDKQPGITDSNGNPPAPVAPNVPAHPTIVAPGSVSESGLSTGSTPGTGHTTTGTITLQPGDGTTTVTVSPPGSSAVTLVPDQKSDPIETPQGTVTLTLTKDSETGAQVITYEYTLTKAVDDSNGQPSLDHFNVTIKDSDGDSDTVSVVVKITDDVPVATDDEATVDNNTDKASGNALGNDTLGADRDTVVTSAQGGKDAAAVVVDPKTGSASVTGQHGTLVIGADGSYTYTRNDDAPLNATDVFGYTITDKDGDTSTATIAITIADKEPAINDSNGQPPLYVPVDPADPAGPSKPVITTPGSVSESGLTDGSNAGKDSTTNTGTVTLVPGEGIGTITVTPPGGGESVTLTSTSPEATVKTPNGEVTLTYKPDNGKGQPAIDYTYELKTPVNDSKGNSSDSFDITITDKDGDDSDSDTVTVVVNITDDVPVGKDDQATVDNDTNKASGNVLGNDTLGADRSTVVTSAQGGKDASAVVVPSTGSTVITGQHGKLVIGADGNYTYTRNDDAPLNATDVFSYTIADKDGDTSTATIAITIADKEPAINDSTGQPPVYVPVDPANPTGPSKPVITTPGSVSESGLTGGSNAGKDSTTTTGTVTLVPGEGIGTITVTPPGGGKPVTLTSTSPEATVKTPNGEATLTYKPDNGKGQPAIDYTYELKTPVNDSKGSSSDSFDITITDKDGDSSDTVTVVVNITDDVPVAEDDVLVVKNGSSSAKALGNDTLGADKDTVITSVQNVNNNGAVVEMPGTGTVKVDGLHGNLEIAADSSYTYTRDNNLPLNAAEVFSYTITDKDGDTSEATITIIIADKQPAINDANGQPPVHTPAPYSAITAKGSVNESGLSGGSNEGKGTTITDTIKVTPGDGTTTVTVTPPGGKPTQLESGKATSVATKYGTVELTYNSGTGEVEYTYTLTDPVNDKEAASNDRFNITVTDADGDSSTVTVVVNIVDDVPTAKADTATVNNGNNQASGNVLQGNGADTNSGKDTVGADGAKVTDVTSNNKAGSTSTVGAEGKLTIQGEHGTLVISPDGSYTYQRTGTEPLTANDVFTYTINDPDGDKSTATLTIVIDDQQPEVTTPLVDKPVDPNNPDAGTRPVIDGGTVSETGLPEGSQPGEGHKTTGTITLKPGDGPASVSVTPPGADRHVELTPNQPQQVETPSGEVKLTYKPDNGQGEPVIEYSYELKEPIVDSKLPSADEFKLTITDKDGDSTSVTVVVDIEDDAPIAKDDTATVDNGSNQASGNVLGGKGAGSGDQKDIIGADSAVLTGITSNNKAGNSSTQDADGKLTIKGEHGTLVISPDGSYSYSYTRNDSAPLNASDIFTYTVTDKDGESDTAKLTIVIDDQQPEVTTPLVDKPVDPNNPDAGTRPVIDGGTVSKSSLPHGSQPGEGHKTTGTITLKPGDGPATVNVTPPGADTPVELTPNQPQRVETPSGEVTLTYKPDNGQGEPVIEYSYELKEPLDGSKVSSTDEFELTITDKDGDSTSVTVVVDITDDAPVARDDSGSTLANTPITSLLAGNDTSGADGNSAWTVATPPANGSVVIDPQTGIYTYTPNSGFIGTDSFTYTITDVDGDTSTATVTITVGNTQPLAFDDSFVTTPGGTASGNVLTGGSASDQADSDEDGHTLTVTQITVEGQTYDIPAGDYVLVHLPGKGALKLSSDGAYEYVPFPQWGGKVPTIRYTITDGYATNSAHLNITVTPIPTPEPVADLPPPLIWDVHSTQLHDPASYEPGDALTQRDAMPAPSVYWERMLDARDMRLPELMHPITYVNNEVRLSQEQHRMQDMLSYWSSWFQTNAQLTSASRNLSMEPTVFVHHAVVASQAESRFWEFLASNMVLNLESQAPAAPTINSNALINDALPDLVNVPAQPAAEDSVQAPSDAQEDALLQRWMQQGEDASAAEGAEAVASNSFHAQLIAQAKALPSGDLIY